MEEFRIEDARQVLKQYWGYEDFRGVQAEIIRSICEGSDTLGLMPTGGGKSIAFQVPALLRDGICLVVTPLIALMRDQVQNLKQRGIRALAIHTGMRRQDIVVTLENAIFGGYKFLYLSPERLETELFRAKLSRMKVSMLVVDESHCISQWGYDFRPSYLRIADIRRMLPGVPVLALTATATPEVVSDIQQRLGFERENVFRMSFERKNLAYIVRKTDDKQGALLRILQRVEGSAIVYVRNRRHAKEIAEWLQHQGISADYYHAGLENCQRDARQQRWIEGACRVIVSTNAFGMGIDKPDVRLVVHMDMPDAIESYFQEAGRAGRDGQRAYAVLLVDSGDKALLRRRIPETFPDKAYIKDVYEHLQYFFQMAMGDGLGCVRKFDLEQFCRTFKHFPVPVDSALRLLTQAGYIEYTDEEDTLSRLRFLLHRDELYKLQGLHEEMDKLIQVVLRLYTGLFSDYAFISEETIALHTGLSRDVVYEHLKQLAHQRIVSYIPAKRTPYIKYTRARMESSLIYLSPAIYEERRKRLEQRIDAMLEYALSDTVCRSRRLLQYFGEKNEHNCGLCDVCRSK